MGNIFYKNFMIYRFEVFGAFTLVYNHLIELICNLQVLSKVKYYLSWININDTSYSKHQILRFRSYYTVMQTLQLLINIFYQSKIIINWKLHACWLNKQCGCVLMLIILWQIKKFIQNCLKVECVINFVFDVWTGIFLIRNLQNYG